jgi:signal transduction histidine kinase
VNKLSTNTGGIVFFYDTYGRVIWRNDEMTGTEYLSQQEFEFLRSKAKQNVNTGYFYIIEEHDGKGQRMVYSKILDSDNFIVIIKPMGVVNEVQMLFIFFLSIIMVFTYIITFFVIYFTSDKLTRPIIKIKDTAKRIASLDFSTFLNNEGEDEVGELVESVNTMAKELKKNIEALNDSNEKLTKELAKEKSLENMRRRFISDVSHELKNPISIILGYANGLEKGIPKTKEDQNYYVHVILEEGKKMNQMVMDLLELSSYEAGTFTFIKEEIEVNELVLNAIERYEYISHEKSIEVILDIDGGCIAYGDRLRLGQVIMNLISNAFKYVDQNGKIIVNLCCFSDKMKFTISNTGSLIPEKELDNIWNSFYQVDTVSDGNGLGLSIVKSIVNIHNGDVRAYVKENMNHFEMILYN